MELLKIAKEIILKEGNFLKGYIEAPKAGDYVASLTFASPKAASNVISLAVKNKKLKATKMHDVLDVLGFSEVDLKRIANEINTAKLRPVYKVIKSKSSPGKSGIETFSTISYRFNQMYKKSGSAWKYMLILNYLVDNKYADIEDLIYVYNGWNRNSMDIYTQKNPDKLLNNVKSLLMQFAQVGLIEVSGEDQITRGPRFYDYMVFVDTKEEELGLK